jgi:hypothetical protein
MKKLLSIIVILLLVGCQKDELGNPLESSQNQTPEALIQGHFTLDKFSDSLGLIKDNLIIDWQNMRISAFESVTWYEFGARQIIKAHTETGIGGKENFTLLAFIDHKGKPNYRLSRFVSYKEDKTEAPSYFSTADFTGINYLYDMQGNLSMLRFIRNGADVSTVVDISENIDGLPVLPEQCMQKAPVNSAYCTDSLDCMLTFSGSEGGGGSGCGGGGGTGGWVAQTTHHYTDWYMNRSDGTWQYQNTQYDGATTDYVWVERSGTGGTNGSYDKESYRYGESSSSGETVRYFKDRPADKPEYELLVDKKKMRDENPCVFSALMGLTRFVNDPLKPEIFHEATPIDLLQLQPFEEPATLTEFILSVFNASREYDYEIHVGDIGDKRNAITTQKKTATKTTYITTVSELYAKKATKLSIARTLIHESIHAYFLKLGHPGSDFLINLNNIAIEKGFISQDNNLNRAHHELMAAYITTMAASLKRWDTLNGSGGSLGDDYYFAMAFGGLFVWDEINNKFDFETDGFKSLVPDENDRLFIKDIVINELDGNENARGQKCSE